MRTDIKGACSRSHGPAAGGQSSDSESPSLPTTGSEKSAGQHHLPAPTGLRRGTSDDHRWTGSKAAETLRQTGSEVDSELAADRDVPLQE